MNKHIQESLKGLLIAALIFGGLGAGLEVSAYAAPQNKETAAPAVKIVNINQANAEELQTIRGIGPAIAERIIQFRQEHGRFEKVEDLVQVRGIGTAKFEKIKTQLSV